MKNSTSSQSRSTVTMRLLFSLLTSCMFISPYVKANANNTIKVEPFIISETYNNILPIKQIIEDDWKQSPEQAASEGFTQNEIGIEATWRNISFGVSKRLDYFIFTNPDTAQAFYSEQQSAFTTPQAYNIKLKLLHQKSIGMRVGYQFNLHNLTAQVKLAYWDLNTSRESHLTGQLNSNTEQDISGNAQLEEYYSQQNFLKRTNNNAWNTNGSGLSLDVHFNWQLTKNISLNGQLKDIYNKFTLKDSGYSQGSFDTSGTFINSIGGVAYLPLYSGIETTQKHQFTLPERIKLTTTYKREHFNYLAQYNRQGDINFYAIGIENSDSTLQFLIDLKNHTPEIHYKSSWYAITLGLDNIKLSQAQKLTLGLSLFYAY